MIGVVTSSGKDRDMISSTSVVSAWDRVEYSVTVIDTYLSIYIDTMFS